MHVLPGHKGLIRSIVFSPDGQLLATSAEVDSQPFGGIIYIWSSSNGELLFELKQHTHWIAGLAFSPNGKHMASCGYDGSVRIWNTQTWKEDQIIGQDERGPVQGVVFHPSSTKFAAIGSGGNFVKVFELGNPRELLKFNPHLAQTNWLSYSPDGQLLATASWDKTIRLWNANDGRLWKTLTGHAAEVNCAVFSPDGQRIASGSKDRSVKVWDVMTGIETLTLKGHSKDVHCVSFSPDGRQLASSSSDGTVKIWDAHTASTSLSEQIQRSREQLKE